MVDSPTQTNGFQWAGGSQGDCITTSLSGTPSSPSAGSTIYNYANVNYTNLAQPILNGSLGGASKNCEDSQNPFRLNLPSNTFERNESHSRFIYQWVSSGGCTSSCNTGYYDAVWTFTWSLKINNTTVMEYESTQKGYIEYGSNVRPFWKINHEIAPIDYNRIAREMADCEESCTFQIQFSDVQKGTSTQGSDFSKAPWETGGAHKIQTYALTEISAELVLVVAPWLLGIIFMIVALASTPFWNPVMGNFKQSMGGGII